ncbi:Glucan endo-1,3-beta-glucosidase 5 [Linum perenne]
MSRFRTAASSSLLLLLLVTILCCWFRVGESAIGVNWGTVSFHRLKPSTVVDLLKDNKIGKVKLFDADPGSLQALMGSGIQVMVGIPNEMLSTISSSTTAADLWVRQNVSRYVVKGGADIRSAVSPLFFGYLMYLTAAKVFNQGLINHVVGNKGTPLRPGVPPMDVYIFGLLDEGAKSVLPGNFERHWGIFSFDGQAKYALNLGQGSKLLKNAKNVQYLPSRWCVADSSKDLTNVANHMRIACSQADCTTLNYGGSCNEIGAKGNISYAFNSYYQLNMQNEKSCDFDGLGMVTFLDPSVGECRFLVGVTESSHSSSCSALSPRLRVLSWLFFIWATRLFLM